MVFKYIVYYCINWNYYIVVGDEKVNRVEIFNQTEKEIEELATVEKVLLSALKKEKLEDVSFNLIIVNNEYIHELNRNYRNIDRETDVITFALEDEDSLVLPTDERVLGDIYISIEKAVAQSEEYGHSLLRELSFLAVHGFYHLLGYDHMNPEDEVVMFQKQEEVLEEYGIKREN